MKFNIKKLCAMMLILTMILSVFGTSAINAKETNENDIVCQSEQTFTSTSDKETAQYIGVTGNEEIGTGGEPDSIKVISSLEDYNNLINKSGSSKKELAATSAQDIPDSVDNSQKKYFPEIGNQGSLGSCTCWAQVYYQFTYMMNRDLDITTTKDNTYSPQWSYNIIAGPEGSIGPYYDAYSFMMKQGSVFLSQVPYTQDTSSFSPSEEVWMTSIKNRIDSFYKFEDIGKDASKVTSPDDEDLAPIKAALANGEVLAYSTHISSWTDTKLKTNASAPENSKYKDEYAVVAQIGREGGHRMTIVGYNDNLWIDINNNDKVDNGEMGALKIANSWGDGYGNKGFAWVAYDALNAVSCVEGVKEESKREPIFTEIAGIKVLKQGTKADLYLKYTLNTSARTQSMVLLSAEKDGTIYSRQAYSNINKGPHTAYDGSKDATDATMVLLLSNADANLTSDSFNDYSINVSFQDTTKDSNILTVKNAEIVDETKGVVYKLSEPFPFTLDGDEKELSFTKSDLNHAVIYYRGYYSPMFNYKLENGSFVSQDGIKLEENTERRGYTHKYVIDLENNDTATLYFSDTQGNVDNNSGQYFTAKKGLNYFVTQNVSTPVSISLSNNVESVADVDNCCDFETVASGGYAPYIYSYTITDLQTNEEINEEYKSNPKYFYYFRKEGKFKITVNVKDYSDAVYKAESVIEIKDIPFSFKSFEVGNGPKLVGESISLNAVTMNEKIKYTGYPHNSYTFVIKDENGNICHENTVKCNKYNLSYRYCEITENFIPKKAGKYSVTVSSTDSNKEYAEISLSFTVFDKIIGDADSSGIINILDATKVQLHIADLEKGQDINKELSDADVSGAINIIDASVIQRYLASLPKSGQVGKIVEYIPPTEPETQPPTEKPTEKPTNPPATKNTVTFTNSFSWSGQLYCYYWSESNTAMTSWPGKAMTSTGKNDFGETLYTFEVPNDVTKIIFTNGSAQTTDIDYNGGEVKYYPISQTDSSGHYLVKTW